MKPKKNDMEELPHLDGMYDVMLECTSVIDMFNAKVGGRAIY